MKFLFLFVLFFSVIAGASNSPLSKVPKNILAEERLQAAKDFETEFELECADGKLLPDDCTRLRNYVGDKKYNAKVDMYAYHKSLAENRALERYAEIVCVKEKRIYFLSKGYAFNQNDNCAAFEAALLVHEPIEEN